MSREILSLTPEQKALRERNRAKAQKRQEEARLKVEAYTAEREERKKGRGLYGRNRRRQDEA